MLPSVLIVFITCGILSVLFSLFTVVKVALREIFSAVRSRIAVCVIVIVIVS
jgi:hypothetical protein